MDVGSEVSLVLIITAVQDDKKQTPLDIALECASRLYHSGCVDVAYYLIVNCDCGSEEEKRLLFCSACFHGELDIVKKLVVKQKINPKGK